MRNALASPAQRVWPGYKTHSRGTEYDSRCSQSNAHDKPTRIEPILMHRGGSWIFERNVLLSRERESQRYRIPSWTVRSTTDTKQRAPKTKNSKLKAAIKDKQTRYHIQELEGLDIVMYENKIYVPVPLRGRTLHWYHHYLSHPGGDRLAQTLSTVCYWKGLQNQSKKFCKKCETCQKYKNARRDTDTFLQRISEN